MGQHLRKGTAGRGFCHVPLCRRHTHRLTQVCGPRPNPPQSADDQRGRASGSKRHEGFLQFHQQVVCAGIGFDRRGHLAVLLRQPAHQRDSRPGISGPIAKGCHAASVFIGQIFQIIKRASARLEPVQQDLPGRLALIGMSEHDVFVTQGCAVFRQFLQAKDNRIIGCVHPGKFGRGCAAHSDIISNRQAALCALLDSHLIARSD